jgi:hypothetical protein
MKVTLRQIFTSWQAINEAAKLTLPIKLAYGLGRFVKDASERYDEIEKQRVALVERLSEADDNGNRAVPPEQMSDFMREFGELLDVDVEVYDPKLTLEALDAAKVEISVTTVASLDWLIKEA